MGTLVGTHGCVVAHTANETAALHNDIHIRRDKQLYAAQKGVDVNLLILRYDRFAQVHTDATAEGIEAGTTERLAMKYVLVATISGYTDDALPVISDGQRTLQPLVGVVLVTADDELYTYIYNKTHTEVRRPGLLPQPFQMHDVPHVGQLQQTCHDENDSNNCSSSHNPYF